MSVSRDSLVPCTGPINSCETGIEPSFSDPMGSDDWVADLTLLMTFVPGPGLSLEAPAAL